MDVLELAKLKLLEIKANEAKGVLARAASLQQHADALGQPELADQQALAESHFNSWEEVAAALKLAAPR